jgi:hypothetical protein
MSNIVDLSASMLTCVGIIGMTVRSLLKYPHIWRYLEVRHRSRARHQRQRRRK